MGRIFAHVSISLDGFINDRDGDLSWWSADTAFNRHIDEMLDSIGSMILGRTAFDALAAFWPHAGPEMSLIQRRQMHELPKFVLSHTPPEATWHNSHPLGPDPAAAIQALRQSAPQDIAVFAGAGAIRSVLAYGLLDELHLVVHPVLLGSGTPLFDGRHPRQALHLADTQRLESGVLVLRYTMASSTPVDQSTGAQS